ncbi:MAG: tetratricopeptide repeat protein [Chryseotalea sp. WA131a]|nr:MAG: tetratricopeptide repeat protein [Chryseotalea sp. WA131a]
MKIGAKIFIFILITHFGCAQKQSNKKETKKKISVQDSIRLYKYLDKVGEFSLFSIKRQLYIDSALTIVPKASQLWQQKAMPLFKQKKYEIGMPYLDSAVKYDKTNHWLEYRAFIKCIFQKSYHAAIKDFNLAQKQNGNSYVMDHSYQFYKSLCYLQLNKFDSAEYLIDKEIKEEIKTRKEAHHLHWLYLGIVQFEKENYVEAIKSFDNGLKLYPQFSDIQFYKALCLYELKQNKQAVELLQSAKENLQKGYGINEDNAIYEAYPYQINKSMVEAFLEGFQEMEVNKK